MQLATKLVSTRRGTLIAALLIALLAGASILLYLNSYRDSLKAQGALVTVLVAKQTIPKGTSGSVVASKDLYTVTTIRESQLLEGAMSDPATLRDKVATREIFEGAQLTATDFAAGGDSLAAQLTDRERIVSVPLDSAHGLIGGIEPGNRVDVYAGFNVIPLGADGRPINGGQARPMLRQILSDVPVVAVGEQARGTELDERQPRRRRRQGGEARLRVRQRQGLAGAAAERGREGGQARDRDDRDHAARRPAGAGPEVRRAAGREQPRLPRLRGARGRASAWTRSGRPCRPARRSARCPWPTSAAPAASSSTAPTSSSSAARRRTTQALEVISAANAQRADRPVVVLYHGSPNGFLERAFEAGADDLVSLPQSSGQLGFAFEKALARSRGAVASSSEGEMITVLGPKGGTGKTVTSSNLAVALALEGRSSVLVDLDLQFGDVGLALGLEPTKTIYDLATSGGTLDGDKVESFLARHPSGARALLAPLRPDQAAAITTCVPAGGVRDPPLAVRLRASSTPRRRSAPR